MFFVRSIYKQLQHVRVCHLNTTLAQGARISKDLNEPDEPIFKSSNAWGCWSFKLICALVNRTTGNMIESGAFINCSDSTRISQWLSTSIYMLEACQHNVFSSGHINVYCIWLTMNWIWWQKAQVRGSWEWWFRNDVIT